MATNKATPGVTEAIRKITPVAYPSSLHVSERKLLLALVDLVLINLSLVGALMLRADLDFTLQSLPDHLAWFVILSVVWFLWVSMLDSYNLVRAANPFQATQNTGIAVILTCVSYLLIPFITPMLSISRFDILIFPAIALAGMIGWRIVYAIVFVQPNFLSRAIIVGAGNSGCTLVRAIKEMTRSDGTAYHKLGYKILGFIDDDASKQATVTEGIPVLGTHRNLVQLAQELHANEIIIAITHSETINSELFEAILKCREMGISITTMAAFYEALTGRVPIEHAGRAFYVAMPLSQSSTHRFYLLLKRLVDLGLGLAGSFVLLCAMPFVWLANRISSPGPLFYAQERVGEGGRTFKIQKFRSMRVDAEKFTGAVWASENDPRITQVGHFLRKTRLDEIPQFWNILKGDMSLIGPRPERPQFVNQLAEQIPYYRVRHAVKPGLTGWAQVKYRYGASVQDSEIKLQYDLYYIKHQGIILDLVILAKTVPVVLGFKGR